MRQIDGENKSVVVSLKETSVDDLENLSFVNVTQENILLKDLVTISVDYLYESPVEAINGVDIGGTKKLQEASVLEIDVRDGFDTGEYEKQLQDIIEDTQGIELVDDESQNLENKNYTLPLYSVNTSNDEQVQEVIGGLVGSPLEIDNQLVAQVGWLLGGILVCFGDAGFCELEGCCNWSTIDSTVSSVLQLFIF
ncbi:MAG: hypothetical protein HC932_05440 [Thermales bacterium]|nr:hypothetical protein [Thermales bacterium]